ALDSELRAHIKGNDPSFELNKLAFFAEATGAVQETHILEAQNAVQNARKSSLQAGFLLFKTSLDNDQVLHERHLAAAKTDEARARRDCDKEKTTGAVAAKVLPWIQDTMQGFGVGLRRTESERLIGWCNYVTSGVLSAGKAEFTVNTITSMAHANPRTFCAVVMLPNRSGAIDAVAMDEDEEDNHDKADSAEAVLHEFVYKVKNYFLESERALRVKTCTLVFDEATVYGNRSGCHQCLLITASDKHNVFHKSKAWRTSVVQGASMLPRGDMVKVERPSKVFASDGKLTRVQELKQHLAGSSVVESFVNALCEPAENHNILVDFLGFDGWPAAYVLGQICKGHKFAAGTICHSLYETKFVGEMTSNKIFSLARENKLKIPGFPNFMSVIKDLKKSNQSNTQPQYTVCTPLADGGLVIKSALIDLWTIKNDGFQDEAEALIKDHNARYNPRGVKRGAEPSEQPSAKSEEPQQKKLCIDKTMPLVDECLIPDVDKLLAQVLRIAICSMLLALPSYVHTDWHCFLLCPLAP
ncbi:Uncharacterized protein SCF082_LOCUS2843, partial [Durusdinium trenchii]